MVVDKEMIWHGAFSEHVRMGERRVQVTLSDRLQGHGIMNCVFIVEARCTSARLFLVLTDAEYWSDAYWLVRRIDRVQDKESDHYSEDSLMGH